MGGVQAGGRGTRTQEGPARSGSPLPVRYPADVGKLDLPRADTFVLNMLA